MAQDSSKMASSTGTRVDAPASQEEDPVAGGALASKSSKPKVPDNFNNLPTKPRLKALKQYIGSFQYRLNSQTNFNAHKLRPLARIMDTARMIIYAPQPIKCVEAVFVALYLTAGLPDVERVPLGFKTELYGQVYQHIVLLVQHGGKWGAFGISRCPDLMNKDLIFDSMSSVIENFKTAYESQGHIVLKVRVGLRVEHNIISPHFVCWRHLNLNLKYTSWSECLDAIDKHAAKGKRLWDLWILSGKGEDPHKSSATRKAPLDTKVLMYNDNAKKKKKLHASRDLTPMKAKLVITEDRVSSEASSSSRSCSESNTVATVASTSGLVAGSSTITETSPPKQSSETTAVLVACPGSAGNSKFRQKKNHPGQEVGDSAKGAKLMRAATSLPRSAGMILDQMLAVSRGFLRTKYFEETPGNGGKLVVHGPKMSTHRQMVVATKPLLSRIPVHVSYQTLNAETLLRKPPGDQVLHIHSMQWYQVLRILGLALSFLFLALGFTVA